MNLLVIHIHAAILYVIVASMKGKQMYELLADFTGEQADDLPVKKGDVLTLISKR